MSAKQNLGDPIPRTWVVDTAKVVSLLSFTHPTPESELYALLASEGWSREHIEHAVNEAQAQNQIRWVAFRGWCAGGRPS